MVEEHQEGSKVEEEAHVDHPQALVDDSEEFQEACLFPWVLKDVQCLTVEAVLDSSCGLLFRVQCGHSWAILLIFLLVAHVPVEGDCELTSRGLPDGVLVQCAGVHVIEAGHRRQGCIADENEEVAGLRVEEND